MDGPLYEVDVGGAEELPEETPGAFVLHAIVLPWLQDTGLCRLAAALESRCAWSLNHDPDRIRSHIADLVFVLRTLQEVAYDRDPRCLLQGWSLETLRASAGEIRWIEAWRGRIDPRFDSVLEHVGAACAVLRLLQNPPSLQDPFIWDLVGRVGRMRRTLARVHGIGDRDVYTLVPAVADATVVQLRRRHKRMPRGWPVRTIRSLAVQIVGQQERRHRNRDADRLLLDSQGAQALEYADRSERKSTFVDRMFAKRRATPATGRPAMIAARDAARARLERSLADVFGQVHDRSRSGSSSTGIVEVVFDEEVPAQSISLERRVNGYGWRLRVSHLLIAAMRPAQARVSARGVRPLLQHHVTGHDERHQRFYAAWVVRRGDDPVLESGFIDYRYGVAVEIHREQLSAPEAPRVQPRTRRPAPPPPQVLTWNPTVGETMALTIPVVPDPDPPAHPHLPASEVARLRASMRPRTQLVTEYQLPGTRIERIQNLPRWSDALAVAWVVR